MRSLRNLFLFFCLSLGICGANSIVLDGKVYDDDAVAELITVITTTSPNRSIPSTDALYKARKSLFQVPALAKCKKIIVFDGIRSDSSYVSGVLGIRASQEQLANTYDQYKSNVAKLVEEDPYFANTELIFCPAWRHLSGAIREAITHVDTPFLFIHHDDLILLKDFDLNGVIATMVANQKVKYVYLGRRPNTQNDHYHGPVDQHVEGITFVPLCRSSGWSDQCHIASVDYYSSFVLPQCNQVFMEHVLHPALKQSVQKYGMAGRELYGTHLYGNLFDGPYVLQPDDGRPRH